MRRLATPLVVAVLLAAALSALPAEVTLLNASYDPTRELYQDFNAAFAQVWQARSGDRLTVRMSHGGSAKQARAVMDGLDADVVTLALGYDIDALAAKAHLLPANWQARLPHHSSPYTSVIVFLVRHANPKAIKDWDDLLRPGVQVVMANPKTSGGARWSYLSAWTYALQRHHGSEAEAQRFLAALFDHIPVLDSGARAATTTFVQRRIGDVLVTWENEAHLARREAGPGALEIVLPSLSLLAEPPVAVVDSVAQRRGTQPLARAYLEYLFTEPGQTIAARHFFRPRSEKVAALFAAQFPAIKTVTIDDQFGGWAKAHQKHFAEAALFDQLQEKSHRR